MAIPSFNIFSGKEDSLPGGKAVSVTDAVALSERLLDDYQSARSSWALQAREDDEFRNNMQWAPEDKRDLDNKDQAPLVVPTIQNAVDQAIAMLTANKPRFQSTAREDSDRRVGRVFSDIMAYIWDISVGNMHLKRVVDDYYVRGMGAMQVYVDPQADFARGEVYITSLNPLDLYIDPSYSDPFCRDAAHIIVSKIMTREQIETAFPDMKGRLKDAKPSEDYREPGMQRHNEEDQQLDQSDVDKSHTNTYEFIDRYSKVKAMYHHLHDTSTREEYIFNDEQYEKYRVEIAFELNDVAGNSNVVTNKVATMEMLAIYEQTGGVYHKVQDQVTGEVRMEAGEEGADAIPGSTVFITLTNKGELIDKGVIINKNVEVNRIRNVQSAGGVERANVILEVSEYPIIPFMNHHNRNPYPMSDVRFVKGMQEYINKIQSLIIAHASTSTSPKLIVPKGSQNKQMLEQELSRAGASIIEVDYDLGEPKVLTPIPLPTELYRNIGDAIAYIERSFGIYPLQQGDPAQAPATFRGTVALDEFGQRRIKSKRDDIEEGLNQVAKVVVEMVQQTYTDRKTIRILKPNHPDREVVFNDPIVDDASGDIVGRINDVTIGNYDLIVVSGSTLPSNRWGATEYLMDFYDRKLIDQVEVLKHSEVFDIEGVLNRSSELAQARQAIEQLQEELKKVRGDLQTSDREAMHDKKRVELEKFKSDLDSISTRADASAKLFESRLGDAEKSISDLKKEDKKESDKK